MSCICSNPIGPLNPLNFLFISLFAGLLYTGYTSIQVSSRLRAAGLGLQAAGQVLQAGSYRLGAAGSAGWVLQAGGCRLLGGRSDILLLGD